MLALLLNAGCQLSGITIVMTYSTMIMHKYGMSHESAALMTLSLAIIKVVTSFPVPWFVVHLKQNKIPPLLLSSTLILWGKVSL